MSNIDQPAYSLDPSVFAGAKEKCAQALGYEAFDELKDSWREKFSKTMSALNESVLNNVEKQHFEYFLENKDPKTQLTYDRSRPTSDCSIAAVGFGLTTYPVGVERGWISRKDAADVTLDTLRTLWNTPQGEAAKGTSGAHGMFYHFLDPKSGTRAGTCEVSTIDTALLMSGVLFAKNYFDGSTPEEVAIRDFADKLYRRVDWDWGMNGKNHMSLGWHPESGFIPYQYSGYNEAMIMLALGLGSPTHPIDKKAWAAYTDTERVTTYGGKPHIEFPPLFGHQYSHSWVDFRGITDEQNRKLGFDYFENSRRAAQAQNYYAVKNPGGYRGYDALNWGLSACDGPLDLPFGIDQDIILKNKFLGYFARGAPAGLDDGTIAPTAAISSMPFAPEIVLPTLYHWRFNRPELWTKYGFVDAFNPTAMPDKPSGWIAKETLGIDQGPIVLMTENHRTGFVWDTMKKDLYLRAGLEAAGFRGGWLDKSIAAPAPPQKPVGLMAEGHK